jgi:hypothetical protein
VLEWISGGKNYITVNRDHDVRTVANGFTGGGAAIALLSVARAADKLKFNVNPLSAAEAMLFDILEAKYKWQS